MPRASKRSLSRSASSYGAGGQGYGIPKIPTTTRPPRNASTSPWTWSRCDPVPGVVAVRRQAGDGLHRVLGTQRHHQRIGLDGGSVDGRSAVAGSIRVTVPCNDADAAGVEARQRTGPVGDRRDAQDRPRLAQPHREVVAAVDEHDLVVLVELLAQRDSRRDPAEAATQDQHACHAGSTTRPSAAAHPPDVTERLHSTGWHA